MCCAEMIACVLAVFAVLPSCGDPLYIGTPYGNAGEDVTETPQPQERKSLYVSGVEYPAGYNWLPELGSGSVEAVMFLMKDGKRIVEIKVGTKHQVSADADMHRIVGDHIYTDYSTDDETIIKRDGVELFRYPDREMINSMMVDGNDVYTLGSPRAGSGFTYRRNGEIVISRGSANIVSGLYRDGEHIVFAYEDVIRSSNDTKYKYYCVTDGEVRGLSITDDIVRVEDIRIIDGIVHYIAAFSSTHYRVYYAGDVSYELKNSSSVLSDFALVYGGGKMFVKGTAIAGSSVGTVFWNGMSVLSYLQNTAVLDWCADNENVYHLASNQTSRTRLILRRNNSSVALPSQYGFVYAGCMAVYDSQCCIAAVNRGNGNSPVLWVDEKVTEYDFNGLFTSVSYQ